MGFHAEAVRRGFEHDLISAAYTSRDPIEGADVWVYGHTHESRDFRVGSGDKVTPLPRIINVNDYLDYITNRIVPDFSREIRAALESLICDARRMTSSSKMPLRSRLR